MLHALAAALLVFVRVADDAKLRELLGRARAATGIEAFTKQPRELAVSGTTEMFGVPGRVSVRAAPDGRCARTTESRVGGREGFDGASTWRVDMTGLPSATLFEARERFLVVTAVELGRWCLEDGPLVVKPRDPDGDGAGLVLRARDGCAEFELDLDEATALPKEMRYTSWRATEVWTFSEWKSESGLAVAHRMTWADEGHVDSESLEPAALVEPGDGAAFTMPTARPRDVTFDAEAPARLVGRLTPTRHLIVKGQIDGKEVGWFIFDSGAGGMIVAPSIGDELGLDRFGRYWIGGAGKTRSEAHLRSAGSITVGPVKIDHPIFSELDLAGLEANFQTKLAGIVGYDLFARVVARVDMKKGTVDLHDPSTFALDGVTWRPLLLHGNHAHVRCTFAHDGEEEGVFRLDTGAPGVSVLFHSPWVKQLGLLEGRATVPFVGLAGVGGAAAARSGRIPWFELGGLTIDEPQVVFCQDESGALADPWTAGTIGGHFLDKFDLVFDYPHQRVGFLAHEPAK